MSASLENVLIAGMVWVGFLAYIAYLRAKRRDQFAEQRRAAINQLIELRRATPTNPAPWTWTEKTRAVEPLPQSLARLDGTRAAVVDPATPWRPMRSCIPHAKCILRNASGMPCFGKWDGKDPQWTAWHPLMKEPQWLRDGLAGPEDGDEADS